MFGHSDKNAVITIKATLADGSPLPKWLKFDATSGTFSGTPPAGEKGKLNIKVTARDKAGTEATVKFKLDAAKSGDTSGRRSAGTSGETAEEHRCRTVRATIRPPRPRFPAGRP